MTKFMNMLAFTNKLTYDMILLDFTFFHEKNIKIWHITVGVSAPNFPRRFSCYAEWRPARARSELRARGSRYGESTRADRAEACLAPLRSRSAPRCQCYTWVTPRHHTGAPVSATRHSFIFPNYWTPRWVIINNFKVCQIIFLQCLLE